MIFIKLLTHREKQKGIQFHTGLNESSEGISFISLDHYFDFYDHPIFWVRIVTLPADAQVHQIDQEYVSNKLILEERISVLSQEMVNLLLQHFTPKEILLKNEDYYQYLDLNLDDLVECIQENGCMIKFIKNPTKEMCLMAIQNHSHAMLYIKNVTQEIYDAFLNRMEIEAKN